MAPRKEVGQRAFWGGSERVHVQPFHSSEYITVTVCSKWTTGCFVEVQVKFLLPVPLSWLSPTSVTWRPHDAALPRHSIWSSVSFLCPVQLSDPSVFPAVIVEEVPDSHLLSYSDLTCEQPASGGLDPAVGAEDPGVHGGGVTFSGDLWVRSFVLYDRLALKVHPFLVLYDTWCRFHPAQPFIG